MSGFGGAVKLTGESEYRAALKQITQNLKEVSSEMKVVTTAFSGNDKSVQALSAKEEVLNKKLTEQTNKLNTLKSAYDSMSKKYAEQENNHKQLADSYTEEKAKLEEIGKTLGTTSKEYQEQEKVVSQLESELAKSQSAQDANAISMSKMRTQINQAQADCNKTSKELDNLGKEAEESGENARKGGDGYTMLKNVLANLGSQAIMSAINGMKKLGSAAAGIIKQSVDSYASYEQLVGGVETLFGDSSDQLIEYAQQAYKTAGVSANEYMEQATSFSATLLQGLKGDTAAAVKYADMAISDMSDNANKMGTDMGMIQNAYQGFAKDNYTMLDNLKLGYGGTAGEMARLINDTGVLGEGMQVTAQTVKDVPFDQMIEAIHKVQQEMGITGTTSKEAASTIEGSTKSMKAAWQNLLTGMADENANLGELIQNLVDNVAVFAQNMIPRVKQAVSGLGDVISAIVNSIDDDMMGEIFDAVGDVIEAVIDMIAKAAPQIIKLVGKLASSIVQSIGKILPQIFSDFKSVAIGVGAALAMIVPKISVLTDGIGKLKVAAVKFFAILAANPIIAAATALAAIGAGLALLVTGIEEANNPLKEFRDDTARLKEENDKLRESIESTSATMENSVTNAEAEARSAESLAGKLEELSSKENKTVEDKEKIKTIVEQLNQLVPELGLAYNEEADKLNRTNEEIQKNIDLRKAQAKNDAYMAAYTKQMENVAQAEIDVANASKQRIEMLKEGGTEFAQFYQDVKKQGLQQAATLHNGAEDIWRYEAACKDMAAVDSELKDAQDNLTEANEQADLVFKMLDDSTSELAKQQGELAESVEDAGNSVGDTSAEAIAAYNEMREAARESIDSQIGLFDNLSDSAQQNIYEMNDALASQKEALNNYADNLETAWQYAVNSGDANTQALVQQIADMGIDGAAYLDEFVRALNEDETAAQALLENFGGVNEAKDEVAAAMVEIQSSASGVADAYSNAEPQVSNAAETTANAAVDAVKNKEGDMLDAATASGNAVAQGIGSTSGSVNAASSMLAQSAISPLQTIAGLTYTWGAEMAANFANGISSQLPAVKNAADAVANKVHDILGHSTPKEGALHGDDKWGAEMASNFAKGMNAKTGEVTTAATNLANAVAKNLKWASSWEAASYTKAVEDRVAKVYELDDISLKEEEKFWKKVLATTKKGTKEYKVAMWSLESVQKEIKEASEADARKWGEDIASSFAKGMNAKTGEVNKASQALADAVTKELSDYGNWEAARYTQMAEDRVNKVYELTAPTLQEEEKFWKKILDTTKKGTKEYKVAMWSLESVQKEIKEESERSYREWGEGIASSFAKGMNTRTGEVTKAAQNLADLVTKNLKDAQNWQAGRYTQAAEDRVAKVYELTEPTLKEEEKFWKQIVKSAKKGTKEYQVACRALESVRKDMAEAAKENTRYAADIANSLGVEKINDTSLQLAKATSRYLKSIKAGKGVSAAYVEQALNRLSDAQTANERTLYEEVKFWKGLVNRTKKGSAAYKQAVKVFKSLKKDMTSQAASYTKQLVKDTKAVAVQLTKDIKDVNKQLKEDVKSVKDTLKQNIQDLNQAYKDAVKARADSITSSMNLFDKSSIKLEEAYKKESYTEILKRQVKNLTAWNKTLNSLEKKIKNSSLMEELQGMGVDQLKVLQQFDAMSAKELREYEALYAQRDKIANSRAKKENTGLLAETKKEIETLKKEANKEIKTLNQAALAEIKTLRADANKELTALRKEYLANLKALGITGTTTGKGVGKQIANGIKSGFKSGMKSVNSDVKKQLKEMLNNIKTTLKIKSPSRVLEDEVGDNMALGIGKGFVKTMQSVTAQMQDVIPTEFNTAGALTAGGMSRAETQPPIVVETRLYLGEKDITDLLTRKIAKKIERNVQNARLAKGAAYV